MSCTHEEHSKRRIDSEEDKSKQDDAEWSPRFFLVEENFGGDRDVRRDGCDEADGDSDKRGIARKNVANEETEAADDGGEEDGHGGGLLVAALEGEFRGIPFGEGREAGVDAVERRGNSGRGASLVEGDPAENAEARDDLRKKAEVENAHVLLQVLDDRVDLGENEKQHDDLNDTKAADEENGVGGVGEEGDEERAAAEQQSAFVDRHKAVAPDHGAAREVHRVGHVDEKADEHLDYDGDRNTLEEERDENKDREGEGDRVHAVVEVLADGGAHAVAAGLLAVGVVADHVDDVHQPDEIQHPSDSFVHADEGASLQIHSLQEEGGRK